VRVRSLDYVDVTSSPPRTRCCPLESSGTISAPLKPREMRCTSCLVWSSTPPPAAAGGGRHQTPRHRHRDRDGLVVDAAAWVRLHYHVHVTTAVQPAVCRRASVVHSSNGHNHLIALSVDVAALRVWHRPRHAARETPTTSVEAACAARPSASPRASRSRGRTKPHPLVRRRPQPVRRGWAGGRSLECNVPGPRAHEQVSPTNNAACRAAPSSSSSRTSARRP
jgi:hypothetical protein